MREESCFSGTIEFYVPPRPPAYTPVAINIPEVNSERPANVCQLGIINSIGLTDLLVLPLAASGQIGVSLVRVPSPARPRSSGYVLEFRDDGAFQKRIEVRQREFRRLLAALKAAFPAQLEAHHVVDIVKIGCVCRIDHTVQTKA